MSAQSKSVGTVETTLEVKEEAGTVLDVHRVPVTPTAGSLVDPELTEKQQEIRDRLRRLAQVHADNMRQRKAGAIAKRAQNTPNDFSKILVPKFLPADHLFIEEGKRYQRPLNEDRVLDIAEHFDPGLFGALQVVDRGSGYYAIVDGQHRWAAVKFLKGDKVAVPCIVDMSVHNLKEEARRFGDLNTKRKAPSYNALFASRLFSGDTDALTVSHAIQKIGMLPASADTAVGTTGHITAMATLERILRMGGESALDTILGLLHEAWGDNVDAYRSPMSEGVFNFYVRYFDMYDRNHLVKVMRQKSRDSLRSPMDVLSDAQRHYAAMQGGAGTSGDQLPQSIAFVLYSLYNANRHYGRPAELGPFQISNKARQITRSFVERYRRAMGLPVRGQLLTNALDGRRSPNWSPI